MTERMNLHAILGDFVVYRNLEPADERLRGLPEIWQEIGLSSYHIPRKMEPDYATAVVHFLDQAQALRLPSRPLKRLLYIGDTLMNDGTAIANLGQHRPILGVICTERLGEAKKVNVNQGITRSADSGSQVHQCLVEGARLARWQQRLGQMPEPPAGGTQARAVVNGKEAREHPADVAIQHGRILSKSQAEDGPRGVRANARQSEKGLPLGGQLAVVAFHHLLGSPVQVACPGIVAQPLPHLVEAGFGQGAQGGEAGQETMVVRDDCLHLGLLEHHLRNPDVVRVVLTPPGEIAAVGTGPGQETVLNLSAEGFGYGLCQLAC